MSAQPSEKSMSVTDALAIRAVQLSAQISCVKLEKLGMRHSGGSVTARLKKFYGLKRNTTPDEVLQVLLAERNSIDKKLGVERVQA